MSDYDDIIDGDRRRVEDRFRELEYEAEIERLRRQGDGGGAAPAASGESSGAGGGGGGDPLADMKAAIDDDAPASPKPESARADGEAADAAAAERYVLALCPHCDAKNRVSLTRLRSGNPICGACKKPLSFER